MEPPPIWNNPAGFHDCKSKPFLGFASDRMGHPEITPLGNDPQWFKTTRFYPEMCLNEVNTQGVFPGCNTKTLRP